MRVRTPLRRQFLFANYLDQRMKKMLETLTRHSCIYCNPVNGRVDIEEWLTYKNQLRGLEWNRALSADWDQCHLKSKSWEKRWKFKKKFKQKMPFNSVRMNHDKKVVSWIGRKCKEVILFSERSSLESN